MDNSCSQTNRSIPKIGGDSFYKTLVDDTWTIAPRCRNRSYTNHSSLDVSTPSIPPPRRIYGTKLWWKEPAYPPKLIRHRGHTLPLSYDCRSLCHSDFRSICIENGFDQHLCGNDWAIATATAIGDIYSISHSLHYAPEPSAAFLTSCFTTSEQNACCRKVSLHDVAKYLTTAPTRGTKVPGIKLRSCWPETIITNIKPAPTKDYQESPPCLANPNLDDCCWNCCDGNSRSRTEFRVSRMMPLYATNRRGEIDVRETQELIKEHLTNIGPVVTSFIVTESFQEYWEHGSGRSAWDPNQESRPKLNQSTLVGQSVVIIGYKHDESGLLWIIRNSWVRPLARRYEDRFTGLIYASRDADHCYGLDAPISTTVNGVKNLIGGPWAIILPDNNIEGLGNASGGPQMDMRIKLKSHINWLIPIAILAAGIVIVLLIVRFVPG